MDFYDWLADLRAHAADPRYHPVMLHLRVLRPA